MASKNIRIIEIYLSIKLQYIFLILRIFFNNHKMLKRMHAKCSIILWQIKYWERESFCSLNKYSTISKMAIKCLQLYTDETKDCSSAVTILINEEIGVISYEISVFLSSACTCTRSMSLIYFSFSNVVISSLYN